MALLMTNLMTSLQPGLLDLDFDNFFDQRQDIKIDDIIRRIMISIIMIQSK